MSRLNQVLGHYQRVAIAIFEAKPFEGELATLNELPSPALIRWHGTEVVLLSVVMSLALALAADFVVAVTATRIQESGQLAATLGLVIATGGASISLAVARRLHSERRDLDQRFNSAARLS